MVRSKWITSKLYILAKIKKCKKIVNKQLLRHLRDRVAEKQKVKKLGRHTGDGKRKIIKKARTPQKGLWNKNKSSYKIAY